ncbi:LysR family transcriptional regulator [Clostridium sp. MCC353]|nr:LysR family transcriptional regulator [Clostridium sp. MCC353]
MTGDAMNVQQLEYIIEIAKEKNITRAAKNLFISQSNLSQYLAKLENELDVPLFIRRRNELVLTDAGREYVDAAKKVIGIKENLYSRIAEVSKNRHIALGVSSQWGMNLLSDVLPRFRTLMPGILLDISEGSTEKLIPQLNEGLLDFALISTHEFSDPLNHLEILKEEAVYLAVPASYAESSQISPDMSGEEALCNLTGCGLILSQKRTALREISDEICSKYHFTADTVCEINSMPLTVKLVANGMGMGFVPQSCINHELPVIYLPLSSNARRYQAIIYRNQMILHSAEQTILKLIHDNSQNNYDM